MLDPISGASLKAEERVRFSLARTFVSTRCSTLEAAHRFGGKPGPLFHPMR
jgi:hypothetical protein